MRHLMGEAHDVSTGNLRNRNPTKGHHHAGHRNPRRRRRPALVRLAGPIGVLRGPWHEGHRVRDPAGNATTVAVLIEAPDLDSLQAALATPEAKVTEEHDGVHVDTIKLFLDV